MDRSKIEQAVKIILQEIGEDTEREGIKYTPTRVARLYENLFYGYKSKLQVMDESTRNSSEIEKNIIPITVFKNNTNDLLIRKVKFVSTCEHHIASITDGQCWVGMIPNRMLLGMNKIDKIVKYFAARLQIQERMTNQIAGWIDKNIQPKGVMVIIKANHMCSELQGDEGYFTTSSVRGLFKEKESVKSEFLKIIEKL